jgi:hypothetical protein
VMSTSRAANEEGFHAKLFQQGLHTMNSHLVDLYNLVVHTGFPQSWSHHNIQRIRESSSSTNPNNYRTIIVGRTFSKLYATILHFNLSRRSLVGLSKDNLGLEGDLDSNLLTKLLITSLHSEPLVRRHDIALQKFIVAL